MPSCLISEVPVFHFDKCILVSPSWVSVDIIHAAYVTLSFLKKKKKSVTQSLVAFVWII